MRISKIALKDCSFRIDSLVRVNRGMDGRRVYRLFALGYANLSASLHCSAAGRRARQDSSCLASSLITVVGGPPCSSEDSAVLLVAENKSV